MIGGTELAALVCPHGTYFGGQKSWAGILLLPRMSCEALVSLLNCSEPFLSSLDHLIPRVCCFVWFVFSEEKWGNVCEALKAGFGTFDEYHFPFHFLGLWPYRCASGEATNFMTFFLTWVELHIHWHQWAGKNYPQVLLGVFIQIFFLCKLRKLGSVNGVSMASWMGNFSLHWSVSHFRVHWASPSLPTNCLLVPSALQQLTLTLVNAPQGMLCSPMTAETRPQPQLSSLGSKVSQWFLQHFSPEHGGPRVRLAFLEIVLDGLRSAMRAWAGSPLPWTDLVPDLPSPLLVADTSLAPTSSLGPW